MQDLFSGINRIVELSKKKREAERPAIIAVEPVSDETSAKLLKLENELIVLKNNYSSLQNQYNVLAEKFDLFSEELGLNDHPSPIVE
jgi:hypothetical protein